MVLPVAVGYDLGGLDRRQPAAALAVEPVGGLLGGWSAGVGAWLLGWTGGLPSRAGLAQLPSPGRKSAIALTVVLVVSVAGAAGSFVNTYRAQIVDQAGRADYRRNDLRRG